MHCILRDGELIYLGKKGEFKIYKCNFCGLGQTVGNQKISYEKYHRDATYKENKSQFENIFKKQFKKITKLKETGGVLEIGSSRGLLLKMFKKRGWKVLGVEPSKEAAQEALKNGVNTLNKTFEEVGLPKASYDVIVLNHVLEHLKDPLSALKKANLLLKEGGVIVINVPNFGSLSAKLFKSNWQHVLPEEHLWHFTPKSLKLALKAVGLKPVSWEAESGIWEYNNPLLEILESFIGVKKRFFTNVLTALPALLISKLKLGTGLSMVGIKK